RLIAQVPLPLEPKVLRHEARKLLERLGHDLRGHSAYGFDHDGRYLAWVEKNDHSPARWDALALGRPAALFFWYRQSPAPMIPGLAYPFPGALEVGWITWHDPSPIRPGMAAVKLDTEGRLIEYQAVPPEKEPEGAGVPPSADWEPLFRAAGLKQDAFRKAAPTLTPPVYADQRKAWVGVFPERRAVELRVEGAAY